MIGIVSSCLGKIMGNVILRGCQTPILMNMMLRPFLDTRNFFYDLFLVLVFFQDEAKNNLVGSFSSGIGLVIEFLPPKCKFY